MEKLISMKITDIAIKKKKCEIVYSINYYTLGDFKFTGNQKLKKKNTSNV